MGIKLIVTDLDGTLLNQDDEINALDKEALLFAKRQGIMVVAATGRPLLEAREYINRIEAESYFIGMNGCQTIDIVKGDLLYERFLSMDAVKAILQVLDRLPVFYEMYSKDGIIALKNRKAEIYSSGLNKNYIQKAMKLINFIEEVKPYTHEVYKFFIPTESPEIAKKIYEDMGTRTDVSVFTSLGNFIEVVPKGCDKVVGLKIICRYCGLRPDEIMVIGDSENDIGMLEYAGVGIAVGNAKPEVKAVADWVVSCNTENGVAEAVRICLKMNRRQYEK